MDNRERTHPSVVIHQAAPVHKVHHSLKAEHGPSVEGHVVRHSQRSSCQLDGLVCFSPGKLLLPHLSTEHVPYECVMISIVGQKPLCHLVATPEQGMYIVTKSPQLCHVLTKSYFASLP